MRGEGKERSRKDPSNELWGAGSQTQGSRHALVVVRLVGAARAHKWTRASKASQTNVRRSFWDERGRQTRALSSARRRMVSTPSSE